MDIKFKAFPLPWGGGGGARDKITRGGEAPFYIFFLKFLHFFPPIILDPKNVVLRAPLILSFSFSYPDQCTGQWIQFENLQFHALSLSVSFFIRSFVFF